MARVYYVQFANVSVSAAQDLFELTPAANKPIEIIAAVVAVRDSETNEQFTCTIKRFSGAYSSGSGGTTPTPVATKSTQVAASFTAEANNTSRASGGTSVVHLTEGWPSQGGWAFTPIPEAEPHCIAAECLVIGFEVAPGAAVAMNGWVAVREY